MASINDLKKLHWDTLFRAKARQPDWPDELTDAWWQKKKSKLGKLVTTGVKAVLDKAQKDFQKASFPQIVGRNWSETDKYADDTARWVGSDGKKVYELFKTLRNDLADIAKKQQKTALPKKDRQTIEKMAKFADLAMISFNKNSLLARVSEARDLQRELILSKQRIQMRSVDKNAKGVGKKTIAKCKALEKQIAKWPQDQDPEATRKWVESTFGGAMNTIARDMSQNVKNYLKAHEMGIALDPSTFDERRVKGLYTAIAPYANAEGTEFLGKPPFEPDIVRAQIRELLNAGEQFEAIVEPIRLMEV